MLKIAKIIMIIITNANLWLQKFGRIIKSVTIYDVQSKLEVSKKK